MSEKAFWYQVSSLYFNSEFLLRKKNIKIDAITTRSSKIMIDFRYLEYRILCIYGFSMDTAG
jgi:hypothetical protein